MKMRQVSSSDRLRVALFMVWLLLVFGEPPLTRSWAGLRLHLTGGMLAVPQCSLPDRCSCCGNVFADRCDSVGIAA